VVPRKAAVVTARKIIAGKTAPKKAVPKKTAPEAAPGNFVREGGFGK
jgi:hypothetical protein